MRYLLDSHVLYWSVFEQGNLPARHENILKASGNIIYISHVSLWELALKQSVGKLKIPDDFHARLEESSSTMLPLSLPHIQRIRHLPFHHRDPFVRMLIAQAQVEKLTLLTDDKDIRLYKDIVSLL